MHLQYDVTNLPALSNYSIGWKHLSSRYLSKFLYDVTPLPGILHNSSMTSLSSRYFTWLKHDVTLYQESYISPTWRSNSSRFFQKLLHDITPLPCTQRTYPAQNVILSPDKYPSRYFTGAYKFLTYSNFYLVSCYKPLVSCCRHLASCCWAWHTCRTPWTGTACRWAGCWAGSWSPPRRSPSCSSSYS